MILKFKLNTRRTIYYPQQQMHNIYIYLQPMLWTCWSG